MERTCIQWHWVRKVDNVDAELCGNLWKLLKVPEIPAEGIWRHVPYMREESDVVRKRSLGNQVQLPRRENKMERRNLRLKEQTARNVECVALQSGEILSEGRNGDQDFHGFEPS